MSVLRFGTFEIDCDSRELTKRGSRIRLRDQPTRLLLLLLDNAGQCVTRERLRHHLWLDGTFVDFDRAINKAVSELRTALGDFVPSPRFVETLSKRGYRFIAEVEEVPRAASSSHADRLQSDSRVAYLTGRYLLNRRTPGDLHRSLGWFERALEAGSDCALALSGIADAQVMFGIWGLQPPDAAFGSARSAASRAIERGPNLAEAHTSFAEVLKDYEWDWRQAEQHYRLALSINPGYATAHQCYAQLLVTLGRHAAAASHMEQAKRADPVSPAINAYLPYIYLAARNHRRAVKEGEVAVDLDPHSPLAHWQLGRAYLFSNQPRRGAEVLEYASMLAGTASMWEAELSFARARAGDQHGALLILSTLIERARRTYVSPYDLAVGFMGIGDHASALECLEQAFDQRVMRILAFGDPEFDALRREPGYRRLRNRLQLPTSEV